MRSRLTTSVITAVSATLLAFASAAVAAAPAHATPTCTHKGTTVSDGGVLLPNECLSNNGYYLVMQGDGNLVLYDDTHACWAMTWVNGNHRRVGDHLYFRMLISFNFITARVVVGTHADPTTWVKETYDAGVATREANLSLNSKGQMYIGQAKEASC